MAGRAVGVILNHVVLGLLGPCAEESLGGHEWLHRQGGSVELNDCVISMAIADVGHENVQWVLKRVDSGGSGDGYGDGSGSGSGFGSGFGDSGFGSGDGSGFGDGFGLGGSGGG